MRHYVWFSLWTNFNSYIAEFSLPLCMPLCFSHRKSYRKFSNGAYIGIEKQTFVINPVNEPLQDNTASTTKQRSLSAPGLIHFTPSSDIESYENKRVTSQTGLISQCCTTLNCTFTHSELSELSSEWNLERANVQGNINFLLIFCTTEYRTIY